jgi:hypothetical protein
MEEILKKLLQSEVLSEETKTDLTEAWKEAVATKKAELREEAMLEVRAELAEQWTTERDSLVVKVDTLVTKQIQEEFQELRSDIERFRDLEAEYAAKIVEEKQQLASQLDEQLDELTTKINDFFEERIVEELEELKEDLELAKQNHFGKKVFEAFATEFANFVDEDSIQAKLSISESKVTDLESRLSELETEKNQLIREQKMEEVLKPLSGNKREQMQFVLQNVETKKLDEAYGYFIKRILKEESTLNESTKETQIVTGEENKKDSDIVTEAKETQADALSQLKRLAGIS